MNSENYLIGKLKVYAKRLLELKQDPCADQIDIMFYEREIDLIGAELFVFEVTEHITQPKVIKFTTACWQTVDETCREHRVIEMDIKWSWKFLKFMWYVEYIPKRKK